MSVHDRAEARVITARRSLFHQVAQVWSYRGLLARMVRKELQVKYKNSVLGFIWSLLNPAMYLVVFYVVFQLVLGAGIPNFAIFLLSGLLVWNLFATSVAGATRAVTANAPLVGKVYFPREVLPLASVGAGLVHFFLQAAVLVAALVVMGHEASLRHAAALPPALLILVVFTAGLALFLAAANVYLRDMEHLVELGLLVWFWMTPIVYAPRLVDDKLAATGWQWIQWLNPLTTIVLAFQRALYNVIDAVGGRPSLRPVEQATEGLVRILPTDMSLQWYVVHLGAVGLGSVAVLLVGLWVFGRLEGNFAEEI